MKNKNVDDLTDELYECRISHKSKPGGLVKKIISIGLLGGALTLGPIIGLRGCGGKKDYDIRLTHDANIETAACFLGDNKIVYTFLPGGHIVDWDGRRKGVAGPPTSLYMIELENNRATKPRKIFDAYESPEGYRISYILDMCFLTGICGVGDDKVVFPACLRGGDYGVFIYNTRTKKLRQIFLCDPSLSSRYPIMVGTPRDEEKIIVGYHRELYYSIPVDTDIIYTPDNPPPKASEEDVEYIESMYKRMLYDDLRAFPYGRRKGMVIKQMTLRDLRARVFNLGGLKDLVLIREKNEE